MDSTSRFEDANYLEKVIYKFTIILLNVIIGGMIYVLYFALVTPRYLLPKYSIIAEVLIIFFLIARTFKRLKLDTSNFLVSGFITAFFSFFLILSNISPNLFPQKYILLNDENTMISYCKTECFSNKEVEKRSISKVYSWRVSQLHKFSFFNSDCCFNRNYDQSFLYATFTIFEIAAQMLFWVALLLIAWLLMEYYSGGRLESELLDSFLKEDISSPRKINTLGITLFIIILLYNIDYSF